MRNAGESPFVGEPTLEIITKCYLLTRNSNIQIGETVQAVLNLLYGQFSPKFSNFPNLILNLCANFQYSPSDQFMPEIAGMPHRTAGDD